MFRMHVWDVEVSIETRVIPKNLGSLIQENGEIDNDGAECWPARTWCEDMRVGCWGA